MELTFPTPCAQKTAEVQFLYETWQNRITLFWNATNIVTYNGVITRIFFTGVHKTHREAKRGS